MKGSYLAVAVVALVIVGIGIAYVAGYLAVVPCSRRVWIRFSTGIDPSGSSELWINGEKIADTRLGSGKWFTKEICLKEGDNEVLLKYSVYEDQIANDNVNLYVIFSSEEVTGDMSFGYPEDGFWIIKISRNYMLSNHPNQTILTDDGRVFNIYVKKAVLIVEGGAVVEAKGAGWGRLPIPSCCSITIPKYDVPTATEPIETTTNQPSTTSEPLTLPPKPSLSLIHI